MPMTTVDDVFVPEVLDDTVLGHFKGKNAFINSVFVQSGAVMVDGSMPHSGQQFVGTQVTVPYFGTIPEFQNNPDGSAISPGRITMGHELATVTRDSIAVEASLWSRFSATRDPYTEMVRQIDLRLSQAMDKRIMAVANTTPLVNDVYDPTAPVTITWDRMVDTKFIWGDESEDIVAIGCHSLVKRDMMKLKDANGRPLLVDSQRDGDFARFCGLPLVVSDRVPLDGSTMGTVTATGTTPPNVTLTGEPNGPTKLTIQIVTPGNDGTAMFRFKVIDGDLWSDPIPIPGGGGPVPLTDTAIDSLVGINGKTGITAVFTTGTYAADNEYTATSRLKVTTSLMQRGACALWFNRMALALQTDKDILADTDLAAMHFYGAAHRYRRRRGGSRTGVAQLKHNVVDF